MVDLSTDTLTYGGMSTWLSPMQAELASVLVERFLETIPTKELTRKVFGSARAKSMKRQGLRHITTTIRARLGSVRLGITAVQGHGYRLHPISQQEAAHHVQRGRARRRRARDKALEWRDKQKAASHFPRNYVDTND